jgi:hypothetical protein
MYGHGFSLWPDQPSCEYPIGSGIEHIFAGGLWVGGIFNEELVRSHLLQLLQLMLLQFLQQEVVDLSLQMESR